MYAFESPSIFKLTYFKYSEFWRCVCGVYVAKKKQCDLCVVLYTGVFSGFHVDSILVLTIGYIFIWLWRWRVQCPVRDPFSSVAVEVAWVWRRARDTAAPQGNRENVKALVLWSDVREVGKKIQIWLVVIVLQYIHLGDTVMHSETQIWICKMLIIARKHWFVQVMVLLWNVWHKHTDLNWYRGNKIVSKQKRLVEDWLNVVI